MFKRSLPLAAALIVALAAFAKPIDSADLKKVNDYIKAELDKTENGQFQVVVDSGEIEAVSTPNGVEELITAVKVSFRGQDKNGVETGNGYLNVALKSETNESLLNTEAGLSYVVDNPKNFFDEYSSYIFDFVQRINQKGLYNADLQVSSSGGGYEVTFTLKPASPDAKSIKALYLKGVFPNQVKGRIDLDLSGVFSLASDLVGNAQKSLTQVFWALQQEREPTEDELKGLNDLFEAVMKEFGFAS